VSHHEILDALWNIMFGFALGIGFCLLLIVGWPKGRKG
jgi:hypothetical protein